MKKWNFLNKFENYYIVGDAINLFMPWLKEDRTCYVENSVGEKFRLKPISLDAFIENDKYDYKAKCEMNKYTATDNISIVIIFDGKPIRIELSKWFLSFWIKSNVMTRL